MYRCDTTRMLSFIVTSKLNPHVHYVLPHIIKLTGDENVTSLTGLITGSVETWLNGRVRKLIGVEESGHGLGDVYLEKQTEAVIFDCEQYTNTQNL